MCQIANIGSGYKKFLSPPNAENKLLKLEVKVSITLHSISNFDSVRGNYEGKFTIRLEWIDSRLTFNNLRNPPKVNGLQPMEMEKIWFPNFVFVNTKNKEFSLLDSKSIIKVLKLGSGSLSDNEDFEMKHIYFGMENPLQYIRFYSHFLECDFYLYWYPFDIQNCQLNISPSSDREDFVQLGMVF